MISAQDNALVKIPKKYLNPETLLFISITFRDRHFTWQTHHDNLYTKNASPTEEIELANRWREAVLVLANKKSLASDEWSRLFPNCLTVASAYQHMQQNFPLPQHNFQNLAYLYHSCDVPTMYLDSHPYELEKHISPNGRLLQLFCRVIFTSHSFNFPLDYYGYERQSDVLWTKQFHVERPEHWSDSPKEEILCKQVIKPFEPDRIWTEGWTEKIWAIERLYRPEICHWRGKGLHPIELESLRHSWEFPLLEIPKSDELPNLFPYCETVRKRWNGQYALFAELPTEEYWLDQTT